MVINSPLLGVIKTGEKAHSLIVCELTDGLGEQTNHLGIVKRYPDITCCKTCPNLRASRLA